jgi:Hint domain
MLTVSIGGDAKISSSGLRMGNIAMSSDTQRMNAKVERTRRNIVRMGAVLGTAALAGIEPAHAVCRTAVGCNCFLKGTKIRTAEGDRNVENLAIDDLLPTMFGGMRPIQWIGRYPFRKSDPSKPWPKPVRPIRIARSAIAPEVPHADLYVTAEHALLIDGLLIPVGNLINGTMIARDEAPDLDELEYFNIKVEGHDVIYAEGVPVETLREVDESAVNFAEYFRMYGDPKTQQARCAPWVSYAGARGELKSRIRSAISPWVDRREVIDVIRDRLEERGIALSRQLEPVH